MKCPHLVVVAGLPCAGKSTLISEGSKERASLLRGAGLEANVPVSVLNAKHLAEGDLQTSSPTLLHYDLFANHTLLANDRLLPLIPRVDRLTFATVLVSAATLRRRHRGRIKTLLRAMTSPSYFREDRAYYRLNKNLRLMVLFRRPSHLRRLHADWFSFTSEFEATHLVTSGEAATPAVHTVDPGNTAQAIAEGMDPTQLLREPR